MWADSRQEKFVCAFRDFRTLKGFFRVVFVTVTLTNEGNDRFSTDFFIHSLPISSKSGTENVNYLSHTWC